MRTRDGFAAFLRRHRAVGELLAGAEMLDIEGFTQLAYATEKFFSADRWALLGDAAAFPDPFYSPGSDFISIACDYVNDLIKRDLGGASRDELADVTHTFDAFMQFRFQSVMLLYRDLYSCFGSYELMRVKLNFDLGCYYNVWLDPFMLDRHLDPRFLMGELRRAPDNLGALRRFSELFAAVRDHLRANGAYYRGNLGRYNRGVDCLREWMDEVGEPRKRRLVNQRTTDIFNYARIESLRLLDRPSGDDEAPWRLERFAGALI